MTSAIVRTCAMPNCATLTTHAQCLAHRAQVEVAPTYQPGGDRAACAILPRPGATQTTTERTATP